MWPFNRKETSVSEEVQDRFDSYVKDGLVLSKVTALMPCYDTRGYRATMRAIAGIVYLPIGTKVTMKGLALKRGIAWYNVVAPVPTDSRLDDKEAKGWINSTALLGT